MGEARILSDELLVGGYHGDHFCVSYMYLTFTIELTWRAGESEQREYMERHMNMMFKVIFVHQI